MKTNEVEVDDRILFREAPWYSSIEEATVVEISPSQKRIKLKWPSNHKSWKNEHETKNIMIVEKLPQKETKP